MILHSSKINFSSVFIHILSGKSIFLEGARAEAWQQERDGVALVVSRATAAAAGGGQRCPTRLVRQFSISIIFLKLLQYQVQSFWSKLFANSFFQRIIALTSHVCQSVLKRDILVLFQTLSTVSHATSPSPQFFSNLELAQITLVLF